MYDETSRCEEDEEVAMLGGEGRGTEGGVALNNCQATITTRTLLATIAAIAAASKRVGVGGLMGGRGKEK